MVFVKSSYSSWLSIVAPAAIDTSGLADGAFSGELLGATTNQPCSLCSTRNSAMKRAASLMIGYTSARYDGSPENRYRSHRWCESHAEAVGHIPQKTPSTGPVIRHISVLWCVTHPPAPYITRAVSRPASDNSLTMSMNGSCISANAVSSAGQ